MNHPVTQQAPRLGGLALGFDLSAVATLHRDRVAILTGDHAVTYAELVQLADRAARRLRSLGVGSGDRVLLLSRSALDTLVVLAGAASIGAVLVPGNWRLTAAEVSGVLDDARPAAVLVDAALRDRLRGLDPAVPVVDLDDDAITGWADSHLPASQPREDRTGVVLQIYTSGTSGQPKGVLLVDANLAQKVRRMGAEWDVTSDSISLLATPLFHIGGLSWALVSLAAGATLVIPSALTTDELSRLVSEGGVTHAFLVPKMLTDLVARLEGEGRSATDLQVVVCGAAPVSAQLQERADAVLGARILQVYGLTETTGAITQLDATATLAAPDRDLALRSAGRPFPWVRLDIRDPETLVSLPPGTPGEIWTRSAQNCRGYWQRTTESQDLIVRGWLRTGDVGFIDPEGRLHITDRIKDMIVSGGENIYSIEVEQALLRHPAVRDVAVVGRTDPEWGERVVAVIEARPGRHLTLAEAAEHVAALIGSYKRPRDLLVVDELPRNGNGKVLKREVRTLVNRQSERDQS